MNRIELTDSEARILREDVGIPAELGARIVPQRAPSDDPRTLHRTRFSVDLTDDEQLDVRQLVADHLMRVGFDEHYVITAEGRILEGLIDKLE